MGVIMRRLTVGGMLLLNYGWHFIQKPFVPVQLVAKINEVLDEALRDQSTDHSIRAK
jgi:hypothetical protein